MAWKVTRAAGPGVHYLGSTSLTFDDDGACVTDDAEAVALARSFPRMFLVQETSDAPPPEDLTDEAGEPPDPGATEGEGAAAVPTEGTVQGASTGAAESTTVLPETIDAPQASGAYTAAELEALTVTDLRDLASTAQIAGASRMTKAELVAALLAAQGG